MGSGGTINDRNSYLTNEPATTAAPEDYVAQLQRKRRTAYIARKGRSSFFKQPTSKPPTSTTGNGGSLLGG